MDFSTASIDKLIVHQVGNKQKDEGVYLSHHVQRVESDLEKRLLYYFLKPFQYENDLYNFSNSSILQFNEVYMYTKITFSGDKENSETFVRNFYSSKNEDGRIAYSSF